MEQYPYENQKALEYAQRWAYSNNPLFVASEPELGDGASFFSQCLLAGGAMENPNRKAGWCHWETGCSPSFCQSKALTSFLLRNRGPGPFAEEVALCRAVPGDLVQLWDSKGPFHSLILVENQGEGPLVASHSFHTWRRHLEDFPIGVPRFFHILGCWK